MAKPTRPRDLEKTIQKSGIEILQAEFPIKLFRRNVAGFTAEHNGKKRYIKCAEPGQADTYGWVKTTGQHIEIEWKRPGEVPTLAQYIWLQECHKTGAIAFWTKSVEFASIVLRGILHDTSYLDWSSGEWELKIKGID